LFLLCGLGNRDFRYFNTRHNAGYLVVERFSERYGIPLDKRIYNCIAGIKDNIVIAKPYTYMNLSGRPVAAIVKAFNIKNEEMMIVHDDLDIEFGRIKIKWDGSDGGHKGVRSVIESLGTKDFYRLKVGISRDPVMAPEEYVLSNFRKDEERLLNDVLDMAAEALYIFIHEGKEKAMSIYNKRL